MRNLGGDPIAVAEARRRLLDAVGTLGTVDTDLRDALGGVLADDVAADRDSPPTDRSAMDGFAVRAADLPTPGRRLRVVAEVRAGEPGSGVRVEAGEAVRVFTGAVIPEGADAVVMVELTEEDAATATVIMREQPLPGQHIRRCGEEVLSGQRVLAAGTTVGPAEVAVLASVGAARVRLFRPPCVGVLATGDEIVAVDAPAAPHEVRNSNAHVLAAQLAEMRLPSRDLGIAGDDPARLDRALRSGVDHDVLLLTGGVSVGKYDLVSEALDRAGWIPLFEQVAMRPGKPVLAGRCGRCLVVGLPGNPVSAFTAFAVLVAPALRRMAGRIRCDGVEVRAELVERLKRRPGRMTYHLARVELGGDHPRVRPVRSSGSGDAFALARANAFVVAEGSTHPLEPGSEVTTLLWSDLPGLGS